jgi:hypothetical protein
MPLLLHIPCPSVFLSPLYLTSNEQWRLLSVISINVTRQGRLQQTHTITIAYQYCTHANSNCLRVLNTYLRAFIKSQQL